MATMNDWLYDKVNRVPKISDRQLAEMRHIEPVLKVANSRMYRRMKGADTIDPRESSFLWDAQPCGDQFTFHELNSATVVTQHHSSVFFKPSLAEVYAWIRFYLGDNWRCVSHFCMGEYSRIGGSTDVACHCDLFGGPILIAGREVVFADGSIGHELVAR